MEEILNRLFSKDELSYNEKIHANLVEKILGVLIDKDAEGLLEQDEYLVQGTINDYLTGHLRNTAFSADRELRAFGRKRIDNGVIHTDSGRPIVFYEVKSYIREGENQLNVNAIYQDLLKLAIKKKEIPYSKVYFLLAGKTRVFRNAIIEEKSILLPEKFTDSHKRTAQNYSLEFFVGKVDGDFITHARAQGIKEFSLSPSRWSIHGRMAVLLWKINKI